MGYVEPLWRRSNAGLIDLCSWLYLDDDSFQHDAVPSATKFVLANSGDRLGCCKYNFLLADKRVVADVGKVSGATGFVQNYAGLVALRFLCGVTEAPYFVGAIFFLSSWYNKTELPFRIAIFYLGYTLASAFGGLIAAGILDGMDGLGGYQSWVRSNRANEIFACWLIHYFETEMDVYCRGCNHRGFGLLCLPSPAQLSKQHKVAE